MADFLVSLRISRLVLDTIDGVDVAVLPDKKCQEIAKVCRQSGLVISLLAPRAAVKDCRRVVDVAHYFGVSHVRARATDAGLGKQLLASGITPCYEVAQDGLEEALRAVENGSRLIMDPASLRSRRRIDVYSKYWMLLCGSVTFLDVRDFRAAYCNFGTGVVGWDPIIRESNGLGVEHIVDNSHKPSAAGFRSNLERFRGFVARLQTPRK